MRPGWPARHADPALGAARQPPPARATRLPLQLGLHIRSRLSGTRHRRGARVTLRKCGSHELASGGDQHLRHPGRPRCRYLGRCGLAPARRQAESARQHQPAATAALQPSSSILPRMSGNTSDRTSSPTASLKHMTPLWTHAAMLGTSSSPNPNVSHQSQHEPGHYRSNPDAVGIIFTLPGLSQKTTRR